MTNLTNSNHNTSPNATNSKSIHKLIINFNLNCTI